MSQIIPKNFKTPFVLKTRLSLASIGVLLLYLVAQPGHSEGESGKLTATELTALLKTADTKAKATNLKVVGTGPSVSILGDEGKTASDRDLKIDAIFLAKALIDRSQGQVTTSKVIFSQPERGARFALIDKKIIDGYDSGKLSPQDLLNSIFLVSVESADSDAEVAEGPMMERRLLSWNRIQKLKEQGTGVQPFEALFSEVERLAKESNLPVLTKKLSYLETKLAEQEEHLKQAKLAQQGRGVILPKGGLTGSSAAIQQNNQAQATKSSAPPENLPVPSANSGKGNRPNLWGQGQGQEFPPPPPPGVPFPQGWGPQGPQGPPGMQGPGGGPPK